MNKNNIYLPVIDILAASIALYLSFLLRFEFNIPKEFIIIFKNWIPWILCVHLLTFFFAQMYSRIWRYTSLFDLYAIIGSVSVSCMLSYLIILMSMGLEGYPRSVLILYPMLLTIFSIAPRLSIRVYFSHYHEDSPYKREKNAMKNKKKLLLIGAGKTGDKITKEILTSPDSNFSIIGFIDDDPMKHGARLHGKKVFCGINGLSSVSIHYDELLITAPSATGDQMRRIVDACKTTGKRYKTVPSMTELINREINISSIRDVSYSDLLGREEVKLDMNSIDNLINGKRVLVTGAGGSIGMELVKQCINFNPSEIICLDINEEKIYNIEQFSSSINTTTIIKAVLCSVNNISESEKVFIENQPQIVFHAAAYKHVPIQELHPWTAVDTNLGGTYNIVKLSDKYKVLKFVFVSTDKAVNPVNVMGATKRASEKLIQSFNPKSETTFMSVRFGNVLGSSGSAIPTFQQQINNGGPLTITHPEMTRYFMSIQEATQLILQCGSFGRDGEIFLLEMGRPIKILQMAKDLIRLSGFEPDIDIPIVFTGLRPGEKLYEELQLLNEKKVTTTHKKIMILKEGESPIPWENFHKTIDELMFAARSLDSDRIQLILKNILPTYKPTTKLLPKIKPRVYGYGLKGEA